MNDDAHAWLEELFGDLAGRSAFGVRLPLVVVSTLMHARARAGGDIVATILVIEPAKAAEIAPIITEAYELSLRERQITLLIARGCPTADMAARLHLSAHTVRDYVKAVFEKVGVSSRDELVAKLFAEHYAAAHFAAGGHDAVDE